MNTQTQITSFRKLNILNDTTIKYISHWKNDMDFDDLISMFDNYGHQINYRIIVELLILLHTYHKDCIQFINQKDHFLIINQLQDQCTLQQKDCYKKAIINQLDNILNLYYNIIKVKTFHSIGYSENSYVMIYRGFNYIRYKPVINDIQTLNMGDVYVTNTFLSTSVLEKIAINFISNDENIENNVLWSIRVNTEHLKELQYSYLGGNISNIHNLEQIIDTNNYESEILLNLGAKLRLIKKYYVNDMTYIYKTIKINGKNYTVYEFEFIGWDLHTTKMILDKVSDLKDCLERGSDDQKKRSLLSPQKTSRTVKKTRTIL